MPYTAKSFIGDLVTLTVNSVVTVQVKSISGPSMEVGTVETTTLGETAKTFIPTISDAGEISFTVNWAPGAASHSDLFAFYTTPSVTTFLVTFPETSTLAGSGIMTKFEVGEITVEDVITADITFKLTGVIVFVPGTTD